MQRDTLTPKPSIGTERPLGIELDRVPREFPGSRKAATAGIRFFLGVGGLLVAYATLFLAAWAVLPSVVPGWRSVAISSGSMSPLIRTGDVVVATLSDGHGLSPETVVVISDPAASGPLTHRIVSVNPDGSYTTRGDANPEVDSTPVLPEHVVAVGRLVVPYVGLPLVWYRGGAWGKLAVWGFFVVFSLWAARFATSPAGSPVGTMMERARPSYRVATLVAVTVVLFTAGAVSLSYALGAFSNSTGNSGNIFTAAACFNTSSTYDFTGITSPSSTHTAEDGEIDVSDAVIDAGTFSARRNTIGGWANWGEATTAEYSNLVGSDNLYYQGADPGFGDNAAMIFEFTVAEDASCVIQIDVSVEAAQGGSPGADLLFVYLWDYTTSSYLVGGSQNGTTDQVVSFSVTTNPANYIQTSDGQLTVLVVNEDTSDWIRVDDITVTVIQGTPPASAAVSGTVVPSATEAEIVTGAETIVITLTNDTWDPTIGADNAKTTALINGIDSAQAEAAGWDAVVKANMTFNDVTRTSNTVVTVTLGAEATYAITANETITVTVPATAVASGSPITATPTFDIDGYLDPWTTGTTHTVSAGSNRLLLVAVYGEDSGAIASVATVTWGGQTLTEIGEAIVGTGYSNLVWLGYLNDAGIAAATGDTIVATWSGTTPNESVLYAAVTLDDVDQTTPVDDSSTGTATNASTVQPAAALSVAVDDIAVYATVSGAQGETHTPATGYFEGTEEDSGGIGQVAANADKTITAAGTEQPTADWINTNNRLAIAAAVIKPAP